MNRGSRNEKKIMNRGIEDNLLQNHSGEDTYQCSFCPVNFSRKYFFKRHLRTHKEENCTLLTKDNKQKSTYACDICKKDFTERSDYVDHLASHSEIKSSTNEVYSIRIDKEKSGMMLIKDDGNKKHYACDVCNEDFSERSSYVDHLINHSQEGTPKHFLLHTEEKSFHCSICEKSFESKKKIENYLLGHSNEKTFKCHICEKAFKLKRYLTAHLHVHDVKTFKCHNKKTFKLKPYLTSHLHIHDVKNSVCNICQKTFIDKRRLKDHLIQNHSEGETYQCSLCPVSFPRKDFLRRHFRTHKEENGTALIKDNKQKSTYACDICKKDFTERSDYVDHLIAHSKIESSTNDVRHEKYPEYYCDVSEGKDGRKRFVCKVCKRNFKFRKHLDVHFRIHSNEKAYKCNFCSKRFTSIQNLKTHFLIHTGEKPFHCDYCSETFRHKASFKIHSMKHINENNLS